MFYLTISFLYQFQENWLARFQDSSRVLSQLLSACCVLGVRCRFCVNTGNHDTAPPWAVSQLPHAESRRLPPPWGAARPHHEPARHGPYQVDSRRHRPAADQPRPSIAGHSREQLDTAVSSHGRSPTIASPRPATTDQPRPPAPTPSRPRPPAPPPVPTTAPTLIHAPTTRHHQIEPEQRRIWWPPCRRRASARRRWREVQGGQGPSRQFATTGGRENAPPPPSPRVACAAGSPLGRQRDGRRWVRGAATLGCWGSARSPRGGDARGVYEVHGAKGHHHLFCLSGQKKGRMLGFLHCETK
jgi:hypothetical protein